MTRKLAALACVLGFTAGCQSRAQAIVGAGVGAGIGGIGVYSLATQGDDEDSNVVPITMMVAGGIILLVSAISLLPSGDKQP